MRDTVAIVGSHPRTRDEFNFSRTDCDIWVFNEAVSNATFPRADAVFQMHAEAIWRNPANRNDPKHYEWLNIQTDTPVYMQDTYPDVPMSRKYPLDEITERYKLNYFTSSVAYALALACHLQYKRIELYGVEMETNTEYQYQRDGVTLWLGIARGQGIELDLHINMINDAPLYGYQGEVVIKYEQFDERIAELTPEGEKLSHEYLAAMADVRKALEMFTADASTDNDKALYGAVMREVDLGFKLGMVDGAKQENQRYKDKADKMREASGGDFLFSRQEFESSAKIHQDKHKAEETRWISIGTTLEHIHRAVKNSAKGSPKRDKMVEEYQKCLHDYLKANNIVGVYKGAMTENFNYMTWLDKHIRAAGGAKSEAVLLERMTQNV